MWPVKNSAADRPVVIVESPFAGDMEANRLYAIRACVDCLRRGEVPYASHLFFPQFLNELEPAERELGLTAGYAMWKCATAIVLYCDRGKSSGMLRAIDRAVYMKLPVVERFLDQEFKNERPDPGTLPVRDPDGGPGRPPEEGAQEAAEPTRPLASAGGAEEPSDSGTRAEKVASHWYGEGLPPR